MTRLALLIVIAFCALAPAAQGARLADAPRETWAPDGAVDAVEVVGDKAYIAGTFGEIGPYLGSLARFDGTTGAQRPGLPRVAGQVWAIEPDDNGGWFVGGWFSAIGGVPRANLAHVLADGTVDPAFRADVTGTGRVPVTQLARYGSTLYVGGRFSRVGDRTRNSLAAVDVADGSVTDFSTTMAPASADITALAVQRVRVDPTRFAIRLYVGGSFSSINNTARSNAAMFEDGVLSPWAPAVSSPVYVIRPDATGVFVAGTFNTVNGQARKNVARVTGVTGTTTTAFTADADGLSAGVAALQRVGSRVYIAGRFATINGVARPHLAAVDPETGALEDWTPDVVAPSQYGVLFDVDALSAPGSVYVAGIGAGLTRYDATSGARAAWQPLPDGADAYTLHASGGDVVFGGDVGVVGGVARDGFAEIDLVTGRPTALDVSVDGTISDLARRGTTLYVAGQFSRTLGPGGATRAGAASFDTAARRWSDFGDTAGRAMSRVVVSGSNVWLTTKTPPTVDDPPNRLVAYRDPVAGSGAHTEITVPTAVTGQGATIWALTATADAVYLGGKFSAAGGQARTHLAAVDSDDGSLLPWAPVVDDFVFTLAAAGDTILVGGRFDTPRSSVAGFYASTGAVTSMNVEAGEGVRALAPLDGTVLLGREATGSSLSAADLLTGAAGTWAPGVAAARTNEIVVSPEHGVFVGGLLSVERGPAFASNLAIFPLSPPAPADVVAAAGDGEARVSFAPRGDGGSPVTQYRVTASPGGATVDGTGSPLTVPGLQNGTAYTFTVTATNAVGTSAASAASAPVTPAAPVPTATPSPVPTATATATVEPPEITAPVLSGLRARPARFTRRRGTRVSLVLDKAATVTFELPRFRLERALPAGGSVVRIRPRRVRPGRHRLRATPLGGIPRTVRVRVVRVGRA